MFTKFIARFRIPLLFGGDDSTHLLLPVMNDTGSSIQGLFAADVASLNIDCLDYATNGGLLDSRFISTAGGEVERIVIQLEMQVVDLQGRSLTDWFITEILIQNPYPDGPQYRLSGSEVRAHLFFATPRGNQCLAVSKTKTGLVSVLPAA
jgi:hypothetical protein